MAERDRSYNRQARGPSASWWFGAEIDGPINRPSYSKPKTAKEEDLGPLQPQDLQTKAKSRAHPIDKLLNKAEDLLEWVSSLDMFSMHKRSPEDEGHGKLKKRKVSLSFFYEKYLAKYKQPNGPPSSTEINDASSAAVQSRGPTQDAYEKFSQLSTSLNTLLEEHGDDITKEALRSGQALQATLETLSQRITGKPLQTPPRSSQPESESRDGKNIPKIVSGHGLGLTAWKSSEIPAVLPELPEILNPRLQEATFTHQGLGKGLITDLNYERLEFIGDSYVQLAATLLISQTFPFHSPGQCSHIRETLIKNVTFARYAKNYGLDKRLKLPDSFTQGPHRANDEKHIKVLGDVFEAYVGAVVLSDPAYGLSRAMQWLKDLWSMEISHLIVAEENNRAHNAIQSPIWSLGSRAQIVDQPDPAFAPLNHKDQLSKAIGCKGVKISYRDAGPQEKDPNTKLPLFTVGVYLDGFGEKNKLLGVAKANGKKEAGMKAAAIALNNKKMMQFYIDKKKAVEAQQAMEAEALLKAGDA